MSFSWRTTFDEALRNLRANALLSVSLAAVTAMLGLSASLFTMSEVGALVSNFHQLVRSGGYVVSATGSNGSLLSAARCEALRSIQGVKAAGGRFATERITSPLLPSSWVELVTGTPGLGYIYWPSSLDVDYQPGGVSVGDGIATRLGIDAPAYLPLASSSGSELIEITSIAPPSERTDQANNSVFIPVAPFGVVQECYVESEPSAASAIGGLLAGWFDDEVNVRPLHPGFSPASYKELHGRASFFASYGAGLLGGLSFGLVVFARRQEYALYRSLGMTPWRISLMLVVELATLVVMPIAIGASLAILLIRPSDSLVLLTTLSDLAKTVLLVLATAGVSSLATARSSFVDIVKGA